uniref:CSON007727 protein n=1 Tax=Culicoides sonorensis TaxID=179676 RepID=A0A336M212_CULSO
MITRMCLIININLLLSIIYSMTATIDSSVDYCKIEKQKCKNIGQHIGCSASGYPFKKQSNCTNIKQVKLSNRNKNYILKLHNNLRNKLASGNIQKYPPASRMLEMFWDTELEATACLHVNYCIMEHDECRATPSYHYPGQNLRLTQYTNFLQTDIEMEFHNGIQEWFEEYKDVEPDIIENYERRLNHKQYGHFTLMSKENNERIGCCHITFERKSPNSKKIEYGHMLTCNYLETNVPFKMVYLTGKPSTRCKDHGSNYKPSKNYKNLCSNPVETEKLTLKNEISKKEPDVSIDYCKLALLKCGNNKHVACKNDSGFDVNPNCKNIQVHSMTVDQKSFLLKEHNFYRNLVASGSYNQFPSASKMIEMKWDKSLENVACHHVQYCHMKHGQCLATSSNGVPGQNLFAAPNEDNFSFLKRAVNTWFNKSYDAPSSIVDNFENSYYTFAFMIKESQSKIGCCSITYEDSHFKRYSRMLTCLYENIVYSNANIYTKGKPASECNEYGDEFATSVTYKNLCAKRNDSNINVAQSTSESVKIVV